MAMRSRQARPPYVGYPSMTMARLRSFCSTTGHGQHHTSKEKMSSGYTVRCSMHQEV